MALPTLRLIGFIIGIFLITLAIAMVVPMATARVIRKMPMMKPMIRKVGNAMKSARADVGRAPFYLRCKACKPTRLDHLQLE